ncbi:hypothetical protein [Marinobacter bohaiensis]|uniref:hypothetical protein n=1 Tax=Marinobacter bohaiensis TaxID=2201898 RepID=UPI000DAF1398|nr:hypothetical protein [Marinobacter bohaiensis]
MPLKPLSLALASALALTACGGPETPQEVSDAFWQSVQDGDAGDVAEWSTLQDESAFDGFGEDWQGVVVTRGRVVIDGDEARIVTRFEGLETGRDEPLESTTFLVRRDGDWRVDYAETEESLTERPVFDQMMRSLEDIGERFRSSFSESSDQAAADIERMSRQLEQRMADADEAFDDQMEAFAEQLEEAMDALSESLNDALEDNPSASPQDRRTLNEAVIRLEENRERLDDEPNARAVADGSKALAEVQMQLHRLGQAFERYQKEWGEQVEDVEKKMSRLTREI